MQNDPNLNPNVTSAGWGLQELLTVCLILVFLSTSLGFQAKRRATKPQSEKSAASGWDSILPFNDQVPRLKPSYLGHDIVSLYNRLEKIDLVKDQFETTEQYKRRIRVAAGTDLHAFWFIGEDDNTFRYDADKQEIAVKIPTERVSAFDSSALAILINIDSKFTHYTGVAKLSSGKTSKKTVNKEVEEYYYLVTHSSKSSLNLTLPMPPERARSIIKELSVLFLCRLNFDDSSLISTETERIRSPTIKNPWDIIRAKKYINVELRSIWIFKGSTGEIQAKIDSP